LNRKVKFAGWSFYSYDPVMLINLCKISLLVKIDIAQD